MPSESALHEVAKTLVDAFDVDLQLWMGNALKKLRGTPAGDTVANWAAEYPLAFEGVLRAASVAVRRLPNDSSLLMETMYTQLSRMPVEVRRAVLGDAPLPYDMPGASDRSDFAVRYEKALQDCAESDLPRVAALTAARRREWVESPARIRTHMLTQWEKQDAERSQPGQSEGPTLGEKLKALPQKGDAAVAKLAPAIGAVSDWLERHGGKQ